MSDETPFVISRIKLFSNNNFIEADYYKSKVSSLIKKTGDEIKSEIEYYSETLPLNLSGMQAYCGNYSFITKDIQNENSFEKNLFQIELKTNRGTIKKQVNYNKLYNQFIPEIEHNFN